MKKGVVLVLLFALFLLPLANPSLSSIPPAIGNDSRVNTFEPAADGSESPESLTSFSSTIENDVLHFPDVFLNTTYHVGDDGDDDWADSKVKDSTYWQFFDEYEEEIYFIHSDPNLIVEGFDYFCYGLVSGGEGYLKVYDGAAWETIITLTPSFAWHNGTHWGDILTDNNVTLQGDTNAAINLASVDYLAIRWHYMTLSSATHYAESFASVDDWSLDAGIAPTTDGDVMSWQHPGDSAFDYIYTNSPAVTGNNYLEIRYRENVTATNSLTIDVYTADDKGGTSKALVTLTPTTTWQTWKGIVGQNVESIRIGHSSSAACEIQLDYLRDADETSFGWQHDGSTTAGVSGTAAISFSTDGDLLNISCTSTGGHYATIAVDTTATSTTIENGYYPFFALEVDASSGGTWKPKFYFSDASFLDGTMGTGFGVQRYNLETEGKDLLTFRIVMYTANSWITLDWGKVYGIANFTYSDSGAGTDDYLYVSSSILYSNIDSGYIEANHDPALSISDTYSVWNLTTGSTAPQFSDYVSSWSSYSSETRGPLQSGTVTDIRLKFTADGDLSALKFIEDSTAPTISDFWTVPYTPTEDDAISLVVFTTDGTGVGAYSVVFNAVDYPSGFVDIDYDATESISESGLWQVEIPSADVVAGYYAFGVTVSDGANVATSLDVFRVTTVYLQITEIVLITATETLAQISGHSNKDATYVIYENDVDSGSGSVASGWFSISWTKDTTAGTYIELGVKFTSGVYSEWINGSYSVASAEVLHVTDTSVSETSTEVQLSGYTDLDCDYYVFSNGTYQSVTGSLTSGSFAVTFNKLASVALHRWGVKFNDTSTTRWVNGSYDVSTVYDWAYISPYTPTGEGIALETFKLYINGSRVYGWKFYNRTDYAYEITIQDYFSNELYNTTSSWSRENDILLIYYTVKIYSQIQTLPIYFTLTMGGTTRSEYIGINEIVRYYLAAGTYMYTFVQGGMVYTGPLVLGVDYYYVVTDLDLWDIWNQPKGGGGDDDVMELYILQVLTFGILGIFGTMFLLQIPALMNFLSGRQTRPQPSGNRRRRH